MDVGYKLYELRRSRGLTQAELGRRVGVSEAAIRAYETGKRRPKQAHLERIAEALWSMYLSGPTMSHARRKTGARSWLV